MKGARAIEPATWVVASGRSLRRMKVCLRSRPPGLPLHVVCRDGLAEPDVGLGDQNVHGLQLRKPAQWGQACCRTRSQDMRQRRRHDTMVRTTMRAVFIRFTFHITATLPRLLGVDQLFVKAWLMRRI